MGEDRVRYLIEVSACFYWRTTKAMRAAGFNTVALGKDKGLAKARAIELNIQWDNHRLGLEPAPLRAVFPAGSLGDAYQKVMAARTQARLDKGIAWTKERA